MSSHAIVPPDAAYVEAVATYRKPLLLRYKVFAQILEEILNRAIHALNLNAIIQVRAKAVPSFAEKAIRKRCMYSDPVNQFGDLCGGRIITECKSDIGPVCTYIRRYFDVDEAASEDVIERLGVSEFGYRSVHFTVSLKSGVFTDILAKYPPATVQELLRSRPEKECREKGLRPGPLYRAEIQVRTLLQHAWAALAYDRFYKSDFSVPANLKREVNRIAAALEEADEDFARTLDAVARFHTYHGSYLPRAERLTEVGKLETVCAYDQQNRMLAGRIARLWITLEAWDRAEARLAPFVRDWRISDAGRRVQAAVAILARKNRSGPDEIEEAMLTADSCRDARFSALLLDYARARWERGHKDARDYLRWAAFIDPANAAALVQLGDTYVEKPLAGFDPLQIYEDAYRADPSEPRVLEAFLYSRILHTRSLDMLGLVKPALEDGIARCRERVAIRVDLPHALYSIGLFALLLRRPYESLTAFAQAVDMDDSDAPVARIFARIERLETVIGRELPELHWCRLFLAAARVAKVHQLIREAPKKIGTAATGDKKKATARELTRLGQRLNRALTALRPLTLQTKPVFAEPVVIFCGGTSKAIEDRVRDYERLLKGAFKGFSGTIFGGGTAAGISGITGSLPPPPAGVPFAKISYLRRHPSARTKLVKDARGRNGYRIVFIPGAGFTALEPIQEWVDILAAGIEPSHVRLLAVNGGNITALELRMALALGAKVGAFPGSGRAVNDLQEDAYWGQHQGLVALLHDACTVRAFVVSDARRHLALSTDQRLALARKQHDAYREKQHLERQKAPPAEPPNLAPWERLHGDLKAANLDQVDDILEKLGGLGLTVRQVLGRPVVVHEFTKREVEYLAEREHGRWTAQKLLGGWRFGTVKDNDKKTHPYLVAWGQLSEKIKDLDRDPVKAIPHDLAALGFEIVPAP